MTPRILFAALIIAALDHGPAAAQSFLEEDRIGRHIAISPDSLPRPGATPSVGNSPRVVPRPAGANLNVPPGFRANLFAEGLRHARNMLVAPNGDVLLAESRAGRITLLRDVDGDGRADLIENFADGLDQPHGLAIRDGHIYVGEFTRIRRLPYRSGSTRADGPAEPVTAENSLAKSRGGHWTRNIVFAPDGRGFFVSVGSRGNTAEEPEPYATIQVFAADGSQQRTFAAGLRNAIGMAIQPQTGSLWTVVNERDGLGDGLVPDYLTEVREGAFYGWPYAYIGRNPDPDYGRRRPDLVASTVVPDVLFRSHSAPISLVFYDGGMFPTDYRGDAFVTFQGSWNSANPTGYKVVRVRFKNGRPVGGYENFATGYRLGGTETAVVWGRPSGIAVAADGALLIADDSGNTIFRVSYVAPR